MKLVIVGPAFPLRGGIAHHVYRLDEALRKRGHCSSIISYSRLYPSFLFPGKTTQDTSRDALEADALSILDSINPITWFRAINTIERLDPDLVLFEWWTPFLAPVIGSMTRLLRRKGFKCILECHNVSPHERSFLDLPTVQYGLGAADALIAFSRPNLAYLKQLFPETDSVYSPLPAPFAFPGEARPEGMTILFFGVIRPYKGLDVLLRALKIAITEVKCNLIIAGESYEPAGKYARMIRELGLEGVVEVDDRYIPNEEILNLLERADVVALPYLRASQSGVLKMALGSGLPAVASNAGSFADEIVDEVNGLLVKPGDPVSLANALIRYFKEGLGPKFNQNLRLAAGTDDSAILVEIIESLAP